MIVVDASAALEERRFDPGQTFHAPHLLDIGQPVLSLIVRAAAPS